jgi:succinate dehydrogenase / fumarate reductase cytochrome b subunit
MPSTRVTDPASIWKRSSGSGPAPRERGSSLSDDPRAEPARLARKLLSLSGVAPLGVFLVVHLMINARALRGEAAFTLATSVLQRLPVLPLVEAVLVFAPLVVHAAIGLWLIVTRAPLAEPSPYSRTIGILMRVTGVMALAFLALHVPELRFRGAGPDASRRSGGELLTILTSTLSSTWHGLPWRGVAYQLGAAATTFHFAAGVWGFFARTRRGMRDDRARRWAAWAVGAIGFTMWLFFTDVVVFHATGARLIGSPAPEPASDQPCPAPSASVP